VRVEVSHRSRLGDFVQKLLIILACVPITPMVVGTIALYRRWARKRETCEVIAAQVLPVVE
jgi:hypothetical protein